METRTVPRCINILLWFQHSGLSSKYVKAQYFFSKLWVLMMTDYLPDLEKRTFNLLFWCSTPILTSFCISVTWMDSLKGDFYCWCAHTETHLSHHQIMRFKSPFRQTHEVVWVTLVYIGVLNLKIKMNTTETIQHHILKSLCFFLWVAHPWLDWLLGLERPPGLNQITDTAAIAQLVICQVDMRKSSSLPTQVVHHLKRIVLDV